MGIKRQLKRVLYIDHNPQNRKAISMLLQNNDFEVDTTENGFQGLSLLEQKEYCLVISEYDMPLMNGVEVLLTIRHTYSKTKLPFIAFTTNQEQDVVSDLIKFGANAYIIRDGNLNTLLKKVQELIK